MWFGLEVRLLPRDFFRTPNPDNDRECWIVLFDKMSTSVSQPNRRQHVCYMYCWESLVLSWGDGRVWYRSGRISCTRIQLDIHRSDNIWQWTQIERVSHANIRFGACSGQLVSWMTVKNVYITGVLRYTGIDNNRDVWKWNIEFVLIEYNFLNHFLFFPFFSLCFSKWRWWTLKLVDS